MIACTEPNPEEQGKRGAKQYRRIGTPHHRAALWPWFVCTHSLDSPRPGIAAKPIRRSKMSVGPCEKNIDSGAHRVPARIGGLRQHSVHPREPPASACCIHHPHARTSAMFETDPRSHNTVALLGTYIGGWSPTSCPPCGRRTPVRSTRRAYAPLDGKTYPPIARELSSVRLLDRQGHVPLGV